MSRLPLPVGIGGFGIGGFSGPHHPTQPILLEAHDKRSSDAPSPFAMQQRKAVRLINEGSSNNQDGNKSLLNQRESNSLTSGSGSVKTDAFSSSSSSSTSTGALRFGSSTQSGSGRAPTLADDSRERRGGNDSSSASFFSQKRSNHTNSILGGPSASKSVQPEGVSIRGPISSSNVAESTRSGLLHGVALADTSLASQSSENDDHAGNNIHSQGGRHTSSNQARGMGHQNHGVFTDQQQFIAARQQQHMMLMQQQQQQQQNSMTYLQPQLYNPQTGRLDVITPSNRGGNSNGASQRSIAGPIAPFMTRGTTGSSTFDQELEKRAALRSASKKSRGPRTNGLKFAFSADGYIVCKDEPAFSADAALAHKVLKEEQSQPRKSHDDADSKDIPSPLLSGISSSATLGGPSDGGDGNLAELLLGSQLLSEAVGEESLEQNHLHHAQGFSGYQTHSADSHQSGLEGGGGGGQYHHQVANNSLHHRYEDGKDTFLGSFLQSRDGSHSGGHLGIAAPSQDQMSTWQLQQQQMQQHQQHHQPQHLDSHQVGPNYNSGMSSFSFNRDELGGSDLWAASQESSGFGGVGAVNNASFGQQNPHLAHGAGVQLQSPWGSSSFLNQQPTSSNTISGNHLSSFGDALTNSHGGNGARVGDVNGGFQMGGSGGGVGTSSSSSSWASFGNFNADVNNNNSSSSSIQTSQGGGSGTFLRLESFAPQESSSTGPPVVAGGIWDSNVLPYLSGGQTEALNAAAMYFQQQQQMQQQQQHMQQQPRSTTQSQHSQGHQGADGASPSRTSGGSRGRGGGHQKQRGRGGGGGGGGH